jgi:hypothetical protein
VKLTLDGNDGIAIPAARSQWMNPNVFEGVRQKDTFTIQIGLFSKQEAYFVRDDDDRLQALIVDERPWFKQ